MIRSNVEFAGDVYRRVPAYRDFLNRRGLSADAPFETLPLLDKAGYLTAYPVTELCWDGSLSECHLIGASSGFSKTGSLFWPKRSKDEADYLVAIEQMLIQRYAINTKRTLCMVCLAFGTWIGGMQIASTLRNLASSGRYPFTVSTPSLNLAEAVEIVAQFGSHFEQIIWMTNPSNVPLIAALLERKGVESRNGRHFFGVIGEYYTENFRSWANERFGHPVGTANALWTGYGSADAGGLGVETTVTIKTRQFLNAHLDAARQIFDCESVPMLLEPAPEPFIEIIDGEIIATKDQMIPLVRYNTKDAGGIFEKAQLNEIPGFPAELRREMPERLLYVYGRAGDAIVFYGTNLMVGEINDHFLSLPAEMQFGGFFQVRGAEDNGIKQWLFKISVSGELTDALKQGYQKALIQFLKSRSLEFNAKYDALCRSVGCELIEIELTHLQPAEGKIKHRYIIEE